MRWLGTSDAYMCPLRVADKSRGGSGHTFCLDVLAVKGTPKWEEFVCEVSQAWMDMELSGSCARPRPRPHWCKQWSFIPGIDKHIRDVSAHALRPRLHYTDQLLSRCINCHSLQAFCLHLERILTHSSYRFESLDARAFGSDVSHIEWWGRGRGGSPLTDYMGSCRA